MKTKIILTLAVICLFCFSLNILVYAQASNDKNKKDQTIEQIVEEGSLTGVVSYFWPRNNPKTIAVTFAGDNSDHYFFLDEDLQVVNKRKLEQIEIGDSVEVTFEKVTKKLSADKEEVQRKAKKIRFIKAASQKDNLISQ